MNSKLLGNPFMLALPFHAPNEGGGGGDAPVGGSPGKPAAGGENFYGSPPADSGGEPAAPAVKKDKLDTDARKSSVIDDDDGAGEGAGGSEGEGAGEGGGEGDEDFGDLKEFLDGEGKGEGEGDGEGEGEDKKKPAKPEPAVLKLDPESLKQLRDSVQPAGKQEGGGEQLTPQQLRAMLNPVEVTEDMLKSLGFEAPTPEQVKGFQQFSNAIVKNAYSLTKVMLQKKEEELMGLITPLLGGYQQAQQTQAKQAFFTKYPSLSKYERLVKAAAQDVQASNPDGSPKSQDQIFKEVAAATVATMRDLGISFKPNANPGAGGRSAVPPPNKQSPSGRSGGVGQAGGKPNDADGDIYARGR